jgi:hypothetical protein
MNSRTATAATLLPTLPVRGFVAPVALLTVVVVLITTLTGAG